MRPADVEHPSEARSPRSQATAGADEVLGTTHWFAVQTKPRREDLAASSLRKAEVEVLLPKCRRLEQPLRALFPGYVLARFCPWTTLDAVRYARGVLRVVSSGMLPLPIPDEAAEELRERMGEHDCIVLKAPELHRGDRVEIQQGPLRGMLGRVEREWDGGRRVTIFLESLLDSQVVVEKRLLARVASAA